MSSVCHSCANELDQSVSIKCRGFCTAVFHPGCTGLSGDMLEEVIRNRQLFWLCKACSSLMHDIRFRKSVKMAHEVGSSKQLNEHSEILEALKTEVMAELKTEIRSNFAMLIGSNSLTPRTSTNRKGVGRRRLFGIRKQPADPSKNLLCGEGSGEIPGGVTVVKRDDPKFWVYLSRISPDVTAEQVISMVKSRLATEDVVAFRLVPKDRDISTLSFVSFKVGMKQELRAKALTASTWPTGIYFREFEEKGRREQNFWKPSETAHPEVTPGQEEMLSENDDRLVTPLNHHSQPLTVMTE